MQIFMPFPDLQKSVSCLDPDRLGNQVYRECKTLITGGWPNHPASKLWLPHKGAIALYALYGLDELTRRGKYYPDHYAFFNSLLEQAESTDPPPLTQTPEFCSGHRAALLAKNPAWYSRFGWTETPEPNTKLAYIWKLS